MADNDRGSTAAFLSELVHESEGRWREWQSVTTPGGGWMPWRRGLVLPRKWRTRLAADHLPCEVELDFEASGGEPRCISVRMLGPSLTPRQVDRVPVGACINHAIVSAACRINDDGSIQVVGGSPNRADILKETRGRPPVDYPRVADVYSAAAHAPLQAVCDAFHVAYSTGQRHVAECRRRGLLPSAKQPAGTQREHFKN
jgi:hypothetical protein